MQASLDSDTLRPVPVEFTGRAAEYFKIWLPNLLLTIVTLGFYSPWAKVRNTQYLYGHVRIEGASFAYTAKPIDLLKGRLLVLLLFLLYIAMVAVMPALEPVAIVMLFLLFPWLVVQAMRFRYRNTMYRNVRFDFSGGFAQAFLEYAVMWLVAIPTFGLAYPYIRWRQSRYIVNHTCFGTTPFRFAAAAGKYYMIYLVPAGIVVACVLFGGLALAVLAPVFALLLASGSQEELPDFPVDFGLALILLGAAVYFVFALIAIYIRARSRNLIFNTASLAEHRFRSNVAVAALLRLWIVNTFALICSLGLAWPWVRVRVARYYASHTTLMVAGDLDDFVARSGAESRAFGEEMGDVFGVDIGL